MPEMTVHVIVPVDVITTERALEAGYQVVHPKRRTYAQLTLECQPSDELSLLASDHTVGRKAGTRIVLDLSRGLKRLVDETPPIPAELPGPSRNPIWQKPAVAQRMTQPVHLPSNQDASELPDVATRWIRSAGTVDDSLLDDLLSRWKSQANRMLTHATEVASSLPATASVEERQGVLKRLDELAAQVRHAQDGGLDPHERDYVQNDYGEHEFQPAHWYVNHAYHDVLDACDRASASGGDRVRSNDVQYELRSILRELDEEAIPARFIAAKELGLIDTMIGAARDELLDAVWPGWRYPSKSEKLRDVSSPQLSVLEQLRQERDNDEKNRPWEHDLVALKWLEPAKSGVLVSSFLGREIILDLEASDGKES